MSSSFTVPRYNKNQIGFLDDIAYSYARTQQNAATNYIERITALSEDLIPPEIVPQFPGTSAAPEPLTGTAPEIEPVVWTMPPVPTAFTGSLTIDSILPEPFDDAPPVLQFGPAPAALSEVLPLAPGVDLNLAFPAELVVPLPAPPAMLSISVRPFSGLNLPEIDFTVPELTIVAPTPLTYVAQDHYNSAVLTAVQAELLDRIQNGGTGLNPNVENAIWDRGREREARTMRDQLDQLDRMESMGFALPPGVWLDARLKIATENAYANMGLSREIMIKQAELEMQNVMQALEQANQLERSLIDYTNQREQRAFEAYRYLTQAQIETYNAQVRAYAAYVDAYRVKATIYEAQVRAEVSRVEAYRAEIAAEQAKAEINTAMVSQYRVQADIALSNIEVYKAQLDAIRTKAEIERTKVEVYGEQIKGFVAKVNAYTAQVEGFRAGIQAEATKQEAYRAQVSAYSAQVDAASKVVDARIAEFRGRLDAKALEWDGYKAAAEAESSKARAVAANNQSLVDGFQAEVSSFNAYNQAMTTQWEAIVRQATATAEIGVAAGKANAESYISTRAIALDAAKVGAQVSAQLGAAALSQLSYSESQSNAYSASEQSSWSNSYSENKSISVPAG